MSKALLLTGGTEAKETSIFVSMFDKFFDALNVSNFTNGTRQRKPFKHPYHHGDDHRLKVWSLYNITMYCVLCKLHSG